MEDLSDFIRAPLAPSSAGAGGEAGNGLAWTAPGSPPVTTPQPDDQAVSRLAVNGDGK